METEMGLGLSVIADITINDGNIEAYSNRGWLWYRL